jgi:hypothetical protein
MASTNEFFLGKGTNSPQALAYLSNSLLLVKRRMDGENALSDSTLAMIMLLILQEQVRHEEASQIHYEGLRTMINLRGGLHQLQSCPTLLLKMSKSVSPIHTFIFISSNLALQDGYSLCTSLWKANRIFSGPHV